jgi:hypothetical protein
MLPLVSNLKEFFEDLFLAFFKLCQLFWIFIVFLQVFLVVVGGLQIRTVLVKVTQELIVIEVSLTRVI